MSDSQIPIPPRISQVEHTQLADDIRTAENADRVRAQAIRMYAQQVADTWPAVYEAIRAMKLETIERLSEADRERVRTARAALLAYTAALARLNSAMKL